VLPNVNSTCCACVFPGGGTWASRECGGWLDRMVLSVIDSVGLLIYRMVLSVVLMLSRSSFSSLPSVPAYASSILAAISVIFLLKIRWSPPPSFALNAGGLLLVLLVTCSYCFALGIALGFKPFDSALLCPDTGSSLSRRLGDLEWLCDLEASVLLCCRTPAANLEFIFTSITSFNYNLKF
jgi:hypothetical protein